MLHHVLNGAEKDHNDRRDGKKRERRRKGEREEREEEGGREKRDRRTEKKERGGEDREGGTDKMEKERRTGRKKQFTVKFVSMHVCPFLCYSVCAMYT